MSLAARWSRIRRGRGGLPPLVDGLEFFGDLSSPDTSIVSGSVATLGDSSGHARHFTQTTSTNRPTYNSSDSNFGGRPSMTFDGVNDWLLGPSFSDGAGGATCTIYGIVNGGSAGRVYTGSGAGEPLLRVFSATVVQGLYTNTGVTAKDYTRSSGALVRYAVVFDGTTGSTAIPKFYVNGVDGGSYSASAASNGVIANSLRAIGANVAGSGGFFNGTLVDPLAYSGAHTAAQVTAVDDWLKWRNGL